VVLLVDRRGRLVFLVQLYRTLCCRDSLGDGRGDWQPVENQNLLGVEVSWGEKS
jgi:hypothetical protein